MEESSDFRLTIIDRCDHAPHAHELFTLPDIANFLEEESQQNRTSFRSNILNFLIFALEICHSAFVHAFCTYSSNTCM